MYISFRSYGDCMTLFHRLLTAQFFIRANKVEVKTKGEGKEGAGTEKAGKEGEPHKRKETKATDSPRAKKQVIASLTPSWLPF